MPRESSLTSRLDRLFDDLLSDRPSDVIQILTEISQVLGSAQNAYARRQITRRLKAAPALSSEVVLRTVCLMHVIGLPALRLVHFLSVSFSGTISLAQFELVVGFLFDPSLSIPAELLYDLTQYTYLERKVLAKRSVELAARLRGAITPDLLLYLYLLSLRDDLANENVHLIHLILKICFPNLKVRGRPRTVSAAEEREIAEAWKSVERSARYAESSRPTVSAADGQQTGLSESASYFLDKYFSDEATSREPAPADAPAPKTGTERNLSFVASRARGGTARSTQRAPRPRRPRAPARQPRPAPVEALPVVPPPQRVPRREARRRQLLPLLPFAVASVLAIVGVSVAFRDVPPLTLAPAMKPAPAALPASPVVETEPPLAPLSARVVERGDSLWTIYRGLRNEGKVEAEWTDFLRLMKERNKLNNPDRIYPGNVLTITTGKD